jgi:MFS family permease
VAIGITFVVASLCSTVLTPILGRVIDRRGNMLPMSIGLALSGILVALLPVPNRAVILAVLTVLTLGGPLVASTIPAMSLMTDAIEAIGAALAFGSMLLNVAWSLGEMLGAPAAASLSHATSDAVPMGMLAAGMLLTLVPVLRMRPHRAAPAGDRPESTSSGGDEPEAGAATTGDQPDAGAAPTGDQPEVGAALVRSSS